MGTSRASRCNRAAEVPGGKADYADYTGGPRLRGAATPNARYVKFFPDDSVRNFCSLIDPRLKHRNGMPLPKTPGLEFGFDEETVTRYAVKHGQVGWTVIR